MPIQSDYHSDDSVIVLSSKCVEDITMTKVKDVANEHVQNAVIYVNLHADNDEVYVNKQNLEVTELTFQSHDTEG